MGYTSYYRDYAFRVTRTGPYARSILGEVMFITSTHRGYTRDGEQVASGRFLVLCQPKEWEDRHLPMRAFVIDNVRMEQCGQFMMASAKWKGHKIALSGSYGGDGLLCSVERVVYDLATPVPAELIKAWSNGGGWNSAGSEAPAMRDWALKTFPERGHER